MSYFQKWLKNLTAMDPNNYPQELKEALQMQSNGESNTQAMLKFCKGIAQYDGLEVALKSAQQDCQNS